MARSNLRMTLDDVCRAFRAMGIPVEKGRLADGIAAGVYPFGKISRHLTEKQWQRTAVGVKYIS